MRTRNVVVLLLLAGLLGFILVQSADSFSQYVNFNEARTASGEVHVVGQWVQREASTYNPESDVFRFVLQDSTGQVAQVQYNNPKPVNFESAEKVVVIGKYHGDVFHASKIVMKCPSKYKEEGIRKEEAAL